MKQALIVFAKVPCPGAVKTRLTPPLMPEEAAALYAAFLHDALAQYVALDAAVRLYLAPTAATEPDFTIPEGVTVHEQVGAQLGERMHHAFIETFASGYEHAVIIGTDHPTLPSAFIEQAFQALAEPLSLVIGPSEDGGYYLLGMNDFFPGVFEGMAYSHDAVFAQTLHRIGTLQAAVTILPEWYDVDTPDDLARMQRDLQAMPGAAPSTRRVLAEMRRS